MSCPCRAAASALHASASRCACSQLYEYEIIKLTLQPLVENALYHGIKNKRGGGHIRVSGALCQDVMIFKVQDDGIGMDGARLAQG